MKQCLAHVRHLFVHLCAGSLSSRTIQSGIRLDDLINELANSLLIFAVGLEGMHKFSSNISDRIL